MYKRQVIDRRLRFGLNLDVVTPELVQATVDIMGQALSWDCLLYTSDAADDLLCVDLGGRRIIKKNKQNQYLKCVNDAKTARHLLDKTLTVTPQKTL